MSIALPVTIVGATGLTGSATLKALLVSSSSSKITTLTRRPLEAPITPSSTSTVFENRVLDLVYDKAATWGEIARPGTVFISCLGATYAAAGGFQGQEKIDLFLNKALAEKARAEGAEIAIIVSSGAANSSSYSPYLRMKGQFQDAVKNAGFKKVVILQPGVLMGARQERRTAEGILQTILGGLGSLGVPIGRLNLAVDGEDVGACIAHLTHNPPAELLTVLSNRQIIDLAQKERASRAV